MKGDGEARFSIMGESVGTPPITSHDQIPSIISQYPIKVPPPNFFSLPINVFVPPLLSEMGHQSLKKRSLKFQTRNKSVFEGFLFFA